MLMRIVIIIGVNYSLKLNANQSHLIEKSKLILKATFFIKGEPLFCFWVLYL